LDMYQKDFELMVFGRIHLPTLGASILYDPLSKQLEDFAKTYTSSSPDMTFVFDLYHAVRELQRTCEAIDFKLADRFPMVKWFGPFVREWLSYSEGKLVQWVESALAQDNLQRTAAHAPHSSSVLDIFTSFQQLVDFLKDLDWPDEIENRRFYFAVFYDTLGALYRYCQLSTELLVRTLGTTRAFQPPPPSKTAKLGKLKGSKIPHNQSSHHPENDSEKSSRLHAGRDQTHCKGLCHTVKHVCAFFPLRDSLWLYTRAARRQLAAQETRRRHPRPAAFSLLRHDP
ncbi:hypothetical protein HDU91_004527, partial [Kappamyces sp. JEL0680]